MFLSRRPGLGKPLVEELSIWISRLARSKWETKEIQSPWSSQAVGVWNSSDDLGAVELSACGEGL